VEHDLNFMDHVQCEYVGSEKTGYTHILIRQFADKLLRNIVYLVYVRGNT